LQGLLAVIVLAAAGALASTQPVLVEGVEFPPTVQVGGRVLELNGAGLRTRAFFKVYAAGLYVPHKASSPAALLAQTGPRRVAITMLRDVDAETFSEAVSDRLKANNTPQQLSALAAQIAQLDANLKAIGEARKGDAIRFEFTPEAGTRIVVNGGEKGAVIPGADLFTAVLRVWLGDDPADVDLKQAFLGR